MARGNRVKLPDTVPPVPPDTWEAFNWLWMFCRWLNDEEVKVPWESTITLDANVSRSFHITLEGNTTLAKPKNLYPGQTLNLVEKYYPQTKEMRKLLRSIPRSI